MKKKIAAARRVEPAKRGRRGARKCPCCGSAPCACDPTCICQELKSEMTDDEDDDAVFDDSLRFSFLRVGEQSA